MRDHFLITPCLLSTSPGKHSAASNPHLGLIAFEKGAQEAAETPRSLGLIS